MLKQLSVTLFWLFISASTYALDPLETKNKREMVTGQFLMEACTVVGETARGMIPYFDCESYIYGVLDSILSRRLSPSQSSQACIPKSIAPWEVYAELVNTPRSQWNQSAVDLIATTLSKKYPCR